MIGHLFRCQSKILLSTSNACPLLEKRPLQFGILSLNMIHRCHNFWQLDSKVEQSDEMRDGHSYNSSILRHQNVKVNLKMYLIFGRFIEVHLRILELSTFIMYKHAVARIQKTVKCLVAHSLLGLTKPDVGRTYHF